MNINNFGSLNGEITQNNFKNNDENKKSKSKLPKTLITEKSGVHTIKTTFANGSTATINTFGSSQETNETIIVANNFRTGGHLTINNFVNRDGTVVQTNYRRKQKCSKSKKSKSKKSKKSKSKRTKTTTEATIEKEFREDSFNKKV